MADSVNTVWIDASFGEEQDGTKDTYTEYVAGIPDVIGSFSIPVEMYSPEPSLAEINHYVEFGADYTSTSGYENFPVGYEFYSDTYSGTINIPSEYFNIYALTSSGTIPFYVDYETGYTAISGAIGRRVAITVGNQMSIFYDTPVSLVSYASTSGVENRVVNYTNFSGNTNVSGEPIPYYDAEIDILNEYSFLDSSDGGVDRTVEVFFAAWIYHYLTTDVYSVDEGYTDGYQFEALTRSGSVDVHYLEAAAGEVATTYITNDVYCSLATMSGVKSEAETVSGKISYLNGDVYSTAQVIDGLTIEVDLFSLRIINFSLDVGEHTDASGFISVDVIDESCPVSTSGTYFMVDGVRVPVTLSGIQDGYRMYYDPEDDFSSLAGTTTFTAHAENECGLSLEQDYYLTFGYVVEYDNHPTLSHGIDYGFKNKVVVRVAAENNASCPQVGSLAWDFESKERFNRDLGASITVQRYAYDTSSISAEIKPWSLAYFYGKEFEVTVTAKDFAGNEMEPLNLNFTIEDKPEN